MKLKAIIWLTDLKGVEIAVEASSNLDLPCCETCEDPSLSYLDLLKKDKHNSSIFLASKNVKIMLYLLLKLIFSVITLSEKTVQSEG